MENHLYYFNHEHSAEMLNDHCRCSFTISPTSPNYYLRALYARNASYLNHHTVASGVAKGVHGRSPVTHPHNRNLQNEKDNNNNNNQQLEMWGYQMKSCKQVYVVLFKIF